MADSTTVQKEPAADTEIAQPRSSRRAIVVVVVVAVPHEPLVIAQ